MRFSPLARTGKRGAETNRTRATVWPAVLRRSGHRCEACNRPADQCGGLDWAHAFGRPGSGLCLGALADSAELSYSICRACHNAIDRGLDLALRTDLRWRAYWRLSQRLQLIEAPHATPEDAVRALVRAAEQARMNYRIRPGGAVHQGRTSLRPIVHLLCGPDFYLYGLEAPGLDRTPDPVTCKRCLKALGGQ